MRNKTPLLCQAMRLLPYFESRAANPDQQRDRAMESVRDQAVVFERQFALLTTAHSRRWLHAAERMETSVTDALHRMQYAVSAALTHAHPRAMPRSPTLRDLYGELTQLHQEFDRVRLEEGAMLAVTTDAIELQDVYLGEFSIELCLDRLAERNDVGAFNVIALDPHPAAGSEGTTHPHVQNDKLCAGEATVAIAHALREGRLCDAFLAVNAVLSTYNAGSPFVRLEDWDGTPCANCGHVVDRENCFYCESCEQDYCDDCVSCCDVCQTSCCRGCLEEDGESGLLCCSACHHQCGRCDRTVDSNSLVQETGLCPGCHEKYLEEEHQQEEVEDECDTHEHDPSRATAPAITAVASGSGGADMAA